MCSCTGDVYWEVHSMVSPATCLLCGLTKHTVGSAPSPHLKHGNEGVGAPRALCSQSHQRRFIGTDLQKSGPRIRSHAPGPTVGAMQLSQTSSAPPPHAHVPTKLVAVDVEPALTLSTSNLLKCPAGTELTKPLAVYKSMG